ncbi:WD40-repeat-containing domain protein [Catenaria anguillulae PL171]|uniref:WD40-repeat-containing domain protein n=1 Tax=Catenaria anguillulae PL171 TaxID=765915 RepID=A0A1Y2HSN0_9FUNG|nr:WD40-repeat-containing domain protein [Catenaria anguillulae PL171]
MILNPPVPCDALGRPLPPSFHARRRDLTTSLPSGTCSHRSTLHLSVAPGLRHRLRNIISAPRAVHACFNQALVPVPTFAADFAPKAIGTRFLAVADEAGTLSVLDTDEPPELMLAARFPAHHNAIFDVQWHPSEPYVATASGDQTAVLWDVERQAALALFSSHSSSVKSIQFNPFDPHMLVTASRDGAVILWDTRCSGVRLGSSSGSSTTNENSEPGTAFGAANVIRNAHAPLMTTNSIKAYSTLAKSSTTISVSSALFVQDRQLASCGAGDGCVRIWDVRKLGSHNAKLRPTPVASSLDVTQTGAVVGPTLSTSSVSRASKSRKFGLSHMTLDRTRNILYTIGMNSRAVALDADSLLPLAVYGSAKFTPSMYTRASLDPTGTYLAVGSTQHNAVIWEVGTPRNWGANVPTGVPAFQLKNGHTAEVSCVTFGKSAVSMRVATCSDDASVRVWKEDDGGEIAHKVREANEEVESGTGDLQYKSWGYLCREATPQVSAEFPWAWDEYLHGPPKDAVPKVTVVEDDASDVGSDTGSSGSGIHPLFMKMRGLTLAGSLSSASSSSSSTPAPGAGEQPAAPSSPGPFPSTLSSVQPPPTPAPRPKKRTLRDYFASQQDSGDDMSAGGDEDADVAFSSGSASGISRRRSQSQPRAPSRPPQHGRKSRRTTTTSNRRS